MTRLPSESWNVTGVDSDRYQVAERCQAPGCKRYPDHKHHLWRRSHLGGDYWWVVTPDGTTIRNVIGLCLHHHDDVTENRAWIKWASGSDFTWHELRSTDGNWQQVGTLSLPAPSATPDTRPDGSEGGREAERCPTCGKLKTKAHVEHAPGPRRPRKSWTVPVPDDHEDGAAVLDELEEGCAEVFGHDDYTSALRRFYTIEKAFVVVLQNRHLVELG